MNPKSLILAALLPVLSFGADLTYTKASQVQLSATNSAAVTAGSRSLELVLQYLGSNVLSVLALNDTVTQVIDRVTTVESGLASATGSVGSINATLAQQSATNQHLVAYASLTNAVWDAGAHTKVTGYSADTLYMNSLYGSVNGTEGNVTLTKAGWYKFSASANIASASSTTRGLLMLYNGSAYINLTSLDMYASGVNPVQVGFVIVYVSASTTFSLYGYPYADSSGVNCGGVQWVIEFLKQ